MERIEHPEHYGGDTPYECIKVMEHWLSEDEFVGFCQGNALKYLCRANKKNPSNPEEDYKKALWYIQKLISFSEEHEDEFRNSTE